MAVRRKNYFKNNSEYTVSYRDMRGVDFSGSGASISPSRFSYLENMYRDYDGEGAGVTESVPGFRKILTTGRVCHGLYSYVSDSGYEYVVLHAGTRIYQFKSEERDELDSLTHIADAADCDSHAFSSGGRLYLFDSETIHVIDEYGAHIYGDDGYEPYVPTTFVQGEPYEQRNLLSEIAKEKYFVESAESFSRATLGLKFAVISDADATAAVVGYDNPTEDPTVHIPSHVTLGNKRYSVIEIAEGAFSSQTCIEQLQISEGVRRIRSSAFIGCTYLWEVITPSSLERIDAGAFADCYYLEYLYLGGGILSIAPDAFARCEMLEDIHYELSEEQFDAIDTTIDKETVTMESVYEGVNLEFPLHSKCLEVIGVRVDGESVNYMTKPSEDFSSILSACLYFDNKNMIEGKEVVIDCLLLEDTFNEYDGYSEALSGTGINCFDAILKSTVSESFDGRIFLSGNKLLPNTVFYSERDGRGICNPLYFGALNYFNDGVGSFPVTSLLSTADALAVFKSADDGCGSIYYHTPRETGIDLVPKIYPVSYIHSGIGCKGASFSFFDDPVFISSQGLSALDKADISGKRSVVTRSHSVNQKLLAKDLSRAKLSEWCGYLVLLCEGEIFLADSRATYIHDSGGREYEWYYLKDIGTYQSDKRVYRYASVAHDGYRVYPTPDADVDQSLTVYSKDRGEYEVLSVMIGGKKYEVYRTDERRGGDFSPAIQLLGVGDLLYFGTKRGDVCVFNNDKRGVAPPYISEMEDFDEEEYREKMKWRIHPYYYSFDGHAPRYALKTVLDNCGIPHLTKSTVKHSLTIKCKSYSASAPVCEVGTDRDGYTEVTSFPGGEVDFSELDFSSFSFITSEAFTVPIAEKEKGWVEKQLALWSNKWQSPFGIYSLTYRFTVKGRIKKQ